MATRNIEMNYYNGSSYDQLYPRTTWSQILNAPTIDTNISYSDISGTVPTSDLPTIPINKGGTNGTTASAGLYNLFSGLSTTSSLSSSYYFPLQYGTSARKITVNNLLSYIENNIDVGSGSNVKIILDTEYIGTGSKVNLSWLSGTTSTDINNICLYIITSNFNPSFNDYCGIGIGQIIDSSNAWIMGFYKIGNTSSYFSLSGFIKPTASYFQVSDSFSESNNTYHLTVFSKIN